MNLSSFDLGRVRALHHLLEEAHVGRAAQALGLTPAAASNALRRLRADFGDPLLVKSGRGVVRTRVGEELRAPARGVIEAAERLVAAARPFRPGSFAGAIHLSLSDHIAAVLLPTVDTLLRSQAPAASLVVSPPPEQLADWLQRTRGVLVGPVGRLAAAEADEGFAVEDLYEDHYVAALRADHRCATGDWDAPTYAALDHVLVVPRGASPRSAIDERLQAAGLSRRIVRVVPSFTLALRLVAGSEAITTMPAFYARHARPDGVVLRPLPLAGVTLSMTLITDAAHAGDAANAFLRALLREAHVRVERGADPA